MTDINLLTDEELARAADLYACRVFARLNAAGQSGVYKHFMLSASEHGKNKIRVEHNLSVGFGPEQKWSGNNAIYGADVIISRIEEDKQTSPNEISLALPAPTSVEYTEFVPVVDDGTVPF